MSNEKGLLASERLPDETVDELKEAPSATEFSEEMHPDDLINSIRNFNSEEDEDAPAVDNDEEIRARVQGVIKDKNLEVKAPIPAIGVLNHSFDAEGKWTKAVVVDKDGIPKPIDNISSQKETSVQVFIPDEGDYLIECSEGCETIEVKSIHEVADVGIDSIVADEFLEPTMLFLNSGPETTYFIIAGHNDTINGLDMNETFRRRKHLADLLEGLDPTISDQLANWIDRADIIRADELDWNLAALIEPNTLRLKLFYRVDEGTTLSSTSMVVWRMIGGKSVGELIQINVNPGSLMAGAKKGSFNMERDYTPDEHVYKVMIINQVNDEPTSITFQSIDGTPYDTMPCYVYSPEADSHINAFKYFGIDDDYATVNVSTNGSNVYHDKEFKFDLIEYGYKSTYVETRVVLEDEVEVFDLRSKKSREGLTDDAFSKPMAHIFKSNNGDSYNVVIVNLPKNVINPLNEEEDEDGTST